MAAVLSQLMPVSVEVEEGQAAVLNMAHGLAVVMPSPRGWTGFTYTAAFSAAKSFTFGADQDVRGGGDSGKAFRVFGTLIEIRVAGVDLTILEIPLSDQTTGIGLSPTTNLAEIALNTLTLQTNSPLNGRDLREAMKEYVP